MATSATKTRPTPRKAAPLMEEKAAVASLAALAQSIYQGSAARQQPMFSEDDLNELLKPLT